METTMIQWLLEQAPAIVIALVVIYFMYKSLLKKDLTIQKKDDAVMAMAEKSIGVAMTYEASKDFSKEEHQRIIKMLEEVKYVVNEIKSQK